MSGRSGAGRAERRAALDIAQRVLAELAPSLVFVRDRMAGGAVAHGTIELVQPDDTIIPVEVRIVFGVGYPGVEPIAYDAAPRWKPDVERHVLENHSFCLYLPGVEKPDLRNPHGFRGWLLDLVVFLHQQLVYDAIGGRRFPGPGWRRGQLAYADHLSRILEAFPSDRRIQVWTAVWRGQAERNWPCPCGSGRKVKRCHEGELAELRRVARLAGLATVEFHRLMELADAA